MQKDRGRIVDGLMMTMTTMMTTAAAAVVVVILSILILAVLFIIAVAVMRTGRSLSLAVLALCNQASVF